MVHQQIDRELAEKEAWALQRQKGIPNNRRLRPPHGRPSERGNTSREMGTAG